MDKSHPKERVEKRRAQLEKTECRYGRAFFLLQEKWVLFTLYNLSEGAMGFNELSRCGVGVNPTTLSQTLSLLEAAGLVTREVQSTMPPKTSYELTEAGRALKPILEAMGEWSALYLSNLSCSLEAELKGQETKSRTAIKSARVKTK
ncbi:MAG: helix-turn-helix transcriptional regulator [Acidobacteriota bacterium]|nr:helix-turn-helix transcriptional regulator [Acidobacteriota bacterium]